MHKSINYYFFSQRKSGHCFMMLLVVAFHRKAQRLSRQKAMLGCQWFSAEKVKELMTRYRDDWVKKKGWVKRYRWPGITAMGK
jgi:hypothetical protein